MAHQLHYASIPRGATGRAGFQFTARSADAPPEVDRLVERFMTYRPPANAPVEQCPVSLAYDSTPHGAIMVCCRYLGADYTGRPGNFLGHAIVASDDELDGVRPIELWRAPWWASREAGGSLPTLETLQPGEAIDPDQVCRLLSRAGSAGYETLATLLDAARDTLAGQAGPVMLISEDVDRIALWIAAVSYSLPLAVTRTMSFVTYASDPLSASHHLVGATPQAWAASRSDGAAHFLPPLPETRARRLARRRPQREPSPYAAAVTAAWRAGDLATIDTLCAVAATGVRDPDGRSTTRGGGLDAAAALLALCRGELVAEQHQEAALRLLEALPVVDQARVLDRTAASLADADGSTIAAVFQGLGGAQLADLLVDRDWSGAPQVARLVYSRHGRRHGERRVEMAGRLADLARVDAADFGQVIGQLWADTEPSAAECTRLLQLLEGRDLEQGGGQADHPAVRAVVRRALANADPADPALTDLTRVVIDRYPTGQSADDSWPPPEPPGSPGSPGSTGGHPVAAAPVAADPVAADPVAADPVAPETLTASARVLAAAAGLAERCAESSGAGSAGAETSGAAQIAEHTDRLAWWRPYADATVSQRAVRCAASLLARLPVAVRVEVMRAAAVQAREMLVRAWLAGAADESATLADLAEITIRLSRCEVAVKPLTAHVVGLARRPFAFRRVHHELQSRSPGLGDELRALVDANGGGWRAVFR
ncbi:MAG: hypothetical protein ACRDTQ_12575, partial [Micromonosporaceae bacterium]